MRTFVHPRRPSDMPFFGHRAIIQEMGYSEEPRTPALYENPVRAVFGPCVCVAAGNGAVPYLSIAHAAIACVCTSRIPLLVNLRPDVPPAAERADAHSHTRFSPSCVRAHTHSRAPTTSRTSPRRCRSRAPAPPTPSRRGHSPPAPRLRSTAIVCAHSCSIAVARLNTEGPCQYESTPQAWEHASRASDEENDHAPRSGGPFSLQNVGSVLNPPSITDTGCGRFFFAPKFSGNCQGLTLALAQRWHEGLAHADVKTGFKKTDTTSAAYSLAHVNPFTACTLQLPQCRALPL